MVVVKLPKTFRVLPLRVCVALELPTNDENEPLTVRLSFNVVTVATLMVGTISIEFGKGTPLDVIFTILPVILKGLDPVKLNPGVIESLDVTPLN